MQETSSAECDFFRLPQRAFLIELCGTSSDFNEIECLEDEMHTRYVIAVFTNAMQIAENGISRLYSSFEEVKMNLDMRWPSSFLDDVDLKSQYAITASIIVSMHEIKGIPPEDLLRSCHDKNL